MALTLTAAGARLDRVSNLGILALTAAWLVYTRLYFILHPAHLTFDPSVFMWGHRQARSHMWLDPHFRLDVARGRGEVGGGLSAGAALVCAGVDALPQQRRRRSYRDAGYGWQ